MRREDQIEKQKRGEEQRERRGEGKRDEIERQLQDINQNCGYQNICTY